MYNKKDEIYKKKPQILKNKNKVKNKLILSKISFEIKFCWKSQCVNINNKQIILLKLYNCKKWKKLVL